MIDRPDPRLDVLLPLFDWRRGFAVSVLNSLDAADPKRRLLDALDPDAPGHEALVERLAKHIAGLDPDEDWPDDVNDDLPGFEPTYSHMAGFTEPPTILESFIGQAEHVLAFFATLREAP